MTAAVDVAAAGDAPPEAPAAGDAPPEAAPTERDVSDVAGFWTIRY